MFTLDELEAASRVAYAVLQPTPQISWPLLSARAGCQIWVKHENHNPTGAFKVRGGLVFLDALTRNNRQLRGIVSATRGNHGLSLAFAARRLSIPLAIVVPHGNSVEKNAAMKALGAELIEAGRDFDEARPIAARTAAERGWKMIPSFDPLLVRGVATYALEFFRAVADLDVVYVPIGLGSGICGVIGVRDLLGLKTRIAGVVATGAPAYALSLEAGRVVPTESARTIADGVACRVPDPNAFAIIRNGVERIVQVTDDEIAEAVRAFFTDTHNVAEGAGAAGLAALLKEREPMRGKRVGLVLTGSNIDRSLFVRLLSNDTSRGDDAAAAAKSGA